MGGGGGGRQVRVEAEEGVKVGGRGKGEEGREERRDVRRGGT